MGDLFDPARFIEAERASGALLSQTLARSSNAPDPLANADKTQGFRHFSTDRERGLATLATLAAPQPRILPWQDDLRTIADLATPDFLVKPQWDRLAWTAFEASELWGAKAVDLGWTTLDIFGCNPDPEARRLDRDGVVMLLWRMTASVHIVDVTQTHWHLADRGNLLMKFSRMARQGQVPIWAAFSSASGP